MAVKGKTHHGRFSRRTLKFLEYLVLRMLLDNSFCTLDLFLYSYTEHTQNEINNDKK